jgi:sugar lactone lactonase YvrE
MRKLLLIILSVLIYATSFAQIITTIAGGLGDGIPATNTSLNQPCNIAIDSSGNFYIADYFNHRIRKVTVSTGIISTVAGNGIAGYGGDGSAATLAKLNYPTGVTLDGLGNIYIADRDNYRIRKVTASTGVISTVAGNGNGGDGSAAITASLNYPTGIALDGSGNIYIADAGSHKIRKITVSTGIISTVAGNGIGTYGGDGSSATSASLYNPRGVAVDDSGNVYIADCENQRIRKVTALTGIISTIAGNGTFGPGGDGNLATWANLKSPYGVLVDSLGNVFIADAGNQRIRKVTASTGIISTIAGTGFSGFSGDNIAATLTRLNGPGGIAFDGAGNFYIADASNDRIRKVTVSTGIISTVAGNGNAAYGGDGNSATSASLSSPNGVAIDGSGNIYIADQYNNRIRKINTSTGIISTVAGNGIADLVGDGSAATLANLYSPCAITLDGSGNIYIVDYNNHRIRKVIASTGIISTVAGNGTWQFGGYGGYSGDGGAATSAKLNFPTGIAVDDSGNIYIADYSNYRIRKVSVSTGIISTVAGGGSLGDGNAATLANLYYPQGVAVDGSGNIYIADSYNHRIRKVTASSGIISTVAGNGIQGYGGDGSAATSANLYYPSGVSVDGSGNIYITDKSNHRIRKVTASSGIISTVAGNGISGFGGDDSSATSAKLNSPSGVALDGSGNIYIADLYNSRIRKVIISIANNFISNSQTICAGSAPAGLTGSTPIGATGIYTYTWLSSTTSAIAGFTAISSTNTINYSPGALTQNTWFRRYVVSGAYTDTSAAVAITVNNAIATNTITGAAQTICSGSTPAPITATTATGGNGTTYAYKWLKSTTSATAGFANAGGNDAIQNFTSNALTQKTWFKRRVSSGVCNADTTAALLVTVIPAIASNTITGTAQTICAGSIPTPIIATIATGGNGTTYAYKWLKSTTSATAGFANAGGIDSIQNFTSNALTQKTWFKRKVSSGVCTDTTVALMISVNPAIATNTITGAAQTICSGSIPVPIIATTATGGNNANYTYKWLKSITSATAGFVNAGGNDAAQNFTSGSLTQNTWFKRRVSSGACTDTTAALMITVNNALANNTITGKAQTICSSSIPATIAATIATGGNGTTYTYKWLKSITNATTGFANAGGIDSIQNFTSGALTQNTWFKRRVSSGACNDTTVALLVTVNPIPATSNITGLTNVARLDTASYLVTGTSGSVFNWVTTKGLVQTGVGTNQIQVKWNIAGMDSIKVTETTNQGCVGVQKTLLVNIGPATRINEINTSNSILVYPNPFNETIHVSLLNNLALNKAILYDLLGKEVLTTHKSEIDVKELKSGVYLIMVIDNNGNSYSQKLIKN